MADTVNLFGSQVKKGYVIAGGAVVVLAIGYGYYKNKKAASSSPGSAPASGTPATATGSTDPYPPDGTVGNSGDPNSTDPSTGMTYGDEGNFAGGYGALDSYGEAGYSGYGGYGGAGYYPTGTTFTTNGQWAQACEDYLVNTVGADATTVAAALGKYITGQAVTSDQVSLIEQAIAFQGYPPQAGPNGDPPSINMSGTGTGTQGGSGSGSSGSGSGSGSGGTPQTYPPGTYTPGPGQPGNPGNPPPQPTQYPAPSGLAASSVTSTGYRLSWQAVRGPHGETPTGYTVATYEQNGTQADQFTVSGTSTSEYGSGGKGLHPGWAYTTHVWANGGQQAPPHASVTVTLKSK